MAGELTPDIEDDLLDESRESLDRVFRALHTVEVTCALLGFRGLERLARAGASVIDGLRSGKIPPGRGACALLRRTVGAVRTSLAHIAGSGDEGAADHAPLLAELGAVHRGDDRALTPPDTAAAHIRVDAALIDRLMALVGELDSLRGRIDARTPAAFGGETARQTLLLFRSPGDGRMAIPLSRVARLEELRPETVERASMPLVELGSVVPERRSAERLAATGAPPPPGDRVPVVVIEGDRGPVGLVVEQLVDIVEQDLTRRRPGGRPGVVGAVVVKGRVTELLDVEAVVRHARRATRETEDANDSTGSDNSPQRNGSK